jgi:hypothetical protein
LIAGGHTGNNVFQADAEVFNPKTRRFSKLPGWTTAPPAGARAVPLPNGDVFIAGSGSTAELFENCACSGPLQPPSFS